MKEHISKYLEFHSMDPEDVCCEITGRVAHKGGVDIHHIFGRGMGGSKNKNFKENLMAVSREFHTFAENNPGHRWWFQLVHLAYMATGEPYEQTVAVLGITDPVLDHIKKQILDGKHGL